MFRSSQTPETFAVKYSFIYYMYINWAKPSTTETACQETSADLNVFPVSIRIPFNTSNVLASSQMLLGYMSVVHTSFIYAPNHNSYFHVTFVRIINSYLKHVILSFPLYSQGQRNFLSKFKRCSFSDSFHRRGQFRSQSGRYEHSFPNLPINQHSKNVHIW
jgi:hypothetical protein